MRLSFRVGLVVVVAAVLLAGSAFGVSGSDTITTVAGVGTAGSAGDGGQATSAQLSTPDGVAVDGQGNVYIADVGNSRVRKVTPGGIISTVAGTGTAGFSGDGGQATSAQLKIPIAVAVDGQGNVYIADIGNQRIRKVTTDGIISTLAGTGTAGFSGDGGQATSAQLNGPEGVAVDAQGNVYISDASNFRVRKVTAGGIISTFAGTGTAGFSGDGGQATSAQISAPLFLAVDSAGNVYIPDLVNQRVRKVTAGGVISTVAGTGTAGFSGDGGQAISAQLHSPVGVGVDPAGNLYIADIGNERVRKVTAGGVISTVAGTGTAGFSGDGGQAISAQINSPVGVAVDGQGSVYFADAGNLRVRKIENKLPTASINASPLGGKVPVTVSFDGSQSSDPDGQITSYAWEFGDGGSASGATVSHQYAKPGTFTAKLTVTDDSGATTSTTKAIAVSARSAPTPPPKLKADTLNVSKAVAGRAFTISTTVKNAKTGKGVKGQVSCTGKLNGKPLLATHHSSSTSGGASCSWQLPKTAHAKHFTGTMTDTYKRAKISRSFSVVVV